MLRSFYAPWLLNSSSANCVFKMSSFWIVTTATFEKINIDVLLNPTPMSGPFVSVYISDGEMNIFVTLSKNVAPGERQKSLGTRFL